MVPASAPDTQHLVGSLSASTFAKPSVAAVARLPAEIDQP
jgi:hypothetical protein